MILNSTLPDLRSKHRAEPVPPETYCLVADIDATLEEKILDLAQRQRKRTIIRRLALNAITVWD